MKKVDINTYNSFVVEYYKKIQQYFQELGFNSLNLVDSTTSEEEEEEEEEEGEEARSLTVYFRSLNKYADIELFEDGEIYAVINDISADRVVCWEVSLKEQDIKDAVNKINEFIKG